MYDGIDVCLFCNFKNMRRPPRTMMEVFKSLPEGTWVQLIENKLILTPSPTDTHQQTVLDIGVALYQFVGEENVLGRILFVPLDTYLDEQNAFQPDIMFIENTNLKKIKQNGLHGAPDLVIEVLSSFSKKYDKGKKKTVYERCGVKEYWIVDPATKEATGYALQENRFVELSKATAVIDSPLLGAVLNF